LNGRSGYYGWPGRGGYQGWQGPRGPWIGNRRPW
jgi:hypothetical protein